MSHPTPMPLISVREQVRRAIRSGAVAVEAASGERVLLHVEASVRAFLLGRGLEPDSLVLEPRILACQDGRWVTLGSEALRVELDRISEAVVPALPSWLRLEALAAG